MSRPRTPVAVADVTGAADRNPKRHSGRSNPKVPKLGNAPQSLTDDEVEAWEMFRDEMPWLGKSDRTLVTIASRLRARMLTEPEISVNVAAQLRLCMSSMGGTPTDRSKISEPEEEEDDPAAAFIN